MGCVIYSTPPQLVHSNYIVPVSDLISSPTTVVVDKDASCIVFIVEFYYDNVITVMAYKHPNKYETHILPSQRYIIKPIPNYIDDLYSAVTLLSEYNEIPTISGVSFFAAYSDWCAKCENVLFFRFPQWIDNDYLDV